MQTVPSPVLIPAPFANDGLKTNIPKTSESSGLSYDVGFGTGYSTPYGNGGTKVSRGDVNAVMNAATSVPYFLQCGGIYTFNQDVCDAIGGYPLHAVLKDYRNGILRDVISLTENNEVNFVENGVDGINWKYLNNPDMSSIYPNYDKTVAKMLVRILSSGLPSGANPIACSAWMEMPFTGWLAVHPVSKFTDTLTTQNYLAVFFGAKDGSEPFDNNTVVREEPDSEFVKFVIVDGNKIGYQTLFPVAKGTKFRVYARGVGSDSVSADFFAYKPV